MRRILYILVLIMFVLCMDKINAYTEYKIGDEVTYNNVDYYVIKDSSASEDSVTLLKAEPLSYEEVQTYSNGTGAQTYDQNGYGGMQYHSSSSVYSTSYVKTTVDAWKTAKAPMATEARLISYEDLLNDLGYENNFTCTGGCFYSGSLENVPNWVYNSNYWYWTMSPNNDSSSDVWNVYSYDLHSGSVSNITSVVRPVITLKKTALGDEDESIIDDNTDKKENSKIDAKDNIDDNKNNETKTTVKVDNTYMSSSIIIIISGFITASISVFTLYKVRNKSMKN